jgi:hypothetical protein
MERSKRGFLATIWNEATVAIFAIFFMMRHVDPRLSIIPLLDEASQPLTSLVLQDPFLGNICTRQTIKVGLN